MSQASSTIGSDKTHLEYRMADNNGKTALMNHHKGSTAPSYAAAGMIWLDDAATPWLLKVYDGTDWITLSSINASTNAIEAYHGTAPLRLLNNATDTGAANAYAVVPVPAITSYVTGQIVFLKPANASTGASTLAVSVLAAKSIKLLDDSDTVSGSLATTGVYVLMYDGTNFIVLNPTLVSVTVKDSNLTIQDDGDATRQLRFQTSGITTATTRTLTVPDASGTLALTSDLSIVPNASYRTILAICGSMVATQNAGTYYFNTQGLAIISDGISGDGVSNACSIYIDPADFPSIGSLTTKLRIRAQLYTNDSAPTGNFTLGLYPFTRPASSGIANATRYTFGTVITGSNGASFVTPSADGLLSAVGSDFAIPEAGHYMIGLVTTATIATSAKVDIAVQLQMRNT